MPKSIHAICLCILTACLLSNPAHAFAPPTSTSPDTTTAPPPATTPKRPSIGKNVGKIFGRITQVTTLVDIALELTDFVMDKENTTAKKKEKEVDTCWGSGYSFSGMTKEQAARAICQAMGSADVDYMKFHYANDQYVGYNVKCETGGTYMQCSLAVPKPDTEDQPNPKTEPVPTPKPGTAPAQPRPDRLPNTAPNDPPAKPKPGEKPANDPDYNPPAKPDTKPKQPSPSPSPNPSAPPKTNPTRPPVPNPSRQPGKQDETSPDKKTDTDKQPDKEKDKETDPDKKKDKDDEQDPNKKTDPDKNPGKDKDKADDKDKDPAKDKDKDPTKDKEKQDPAKDKDKDKPKTGTQTTTTTTTDVELDFELPDFCDWAKWICEDDLENKDDSRVDIETEPIPIDSVSIRFGGTCPGDSTFPFVIGGQQLTFTLSYQYVCQIALAMGGIVKILSTIVAMYILTGIKS